MALETLLHLLANSTVSTKSITFELFIIFYMHSLVICFIANCSAVTEKQAHTLVSGSANSDTLSSHFTANSKTRYRRTSPQDELFSQGHYDDLDKAEINSNVLYRNGETEKVRQFVFVA